MNDSHDRDALRFTLGWVSTHDYAVSGSQVLLELLPITRTHTDIVEREEALHRAARRITAADQVLASV
ncbi:hypothetical protein DFR67_101497 [Williamsia limnetica]|uniref:Uncharacterized protein n=1 Tax=Williamsia limnetica TaxID=882452 RepID=A0A318RTW6_WILLI|nr:hypothetical protein [Williamsia limnetica]PYE21099.1 hypothetical protein DFR67_101497 [Williamsia limnetica]